MKPISAHLRFLFSPALLLGLLLPAQASGKVIEFVIDPARSSVQVEPGSNLFLKFGKPAQMLNSVTMPAMAPTMGTGGVLPDGSTSNGLFTSL